MPQRRAKSRLPASVGYTFTPSNSVLPKVSIDIESTLRRAAELHLKGEAAEAEALYPTVLRAQPRNPGALHMLGVLATRAGNARRALELIAQAITIDPNQAAAYSNLGNALMVLGRHAEALDLFWP
jgi:Flp pilus assembly protein TadD